MARIFVGVNLNRPTISSSGRATAGFAHFRTPLSKHVGPEMKAQLVSIEEDEGGIAVVSFDGVEISAMDCLGYGESVQSYPMVGQFFEPRFTCLFDDDDPVDWNSLFDGNPFEEQRLKSTGTWSYRAFGRLVAGDSTDQNLLVDCGGPLIPLPIDVYGDEKIGAYVAFNILRLSVWSV